MSVDAGIRRPNRWSLNLGLLDYRQMRPSAEMGDSRLNLSPTGADARLGREFNLSFVRRRPPRLDLIFDAGVLRPGPAFLHAPAWVYTFRQELRIYF
jgi:hypothetical protein